MTHLPIDSDLPADARGREAMVVAVVAFGGFVGALGRYELGLAWPPSAGHIPWATLTINTSGAFLLIRWNVDFIGVRLWICVEGGGGDRSRLLAVLRVDRKRLVQALRINRSRRVVD